jgi:hypothetical protein
MIDQADWGDPDLLVASVLRQTLCLLSGGHRFNISRRQTAWTGTVPAKDSVNV